jgi:hypothetical protein
VLVAGIFSADPSVRTSSANEIMVNWYKTSGIVDALLAYASAHMDNANGIFNTVVVLQNMNGRVLKIKQQDILTFLKQVISMKNMDKTKQNARALSAAVIINRVKSPAKREDIGSIFAFFYLLYTAMSLT